LYSIYQEYELSSQSIKRQIETFEQKLNKIEQALELSQKSLSIGKQKLIKIYP